uniref:SP-RING-type domain-containing protein n=1 Tax=Meloidogyne javanica TaxID=6303 RepID=A0A915LW94_MELJA
MKEEEDKQQQQNNSSPPASYVLFDTNIASTSKIINTKIDVGPNVSSNFVENKNSFDNENEQNLKECGQKLIQNGVLNEIVQFAEENEKILQEENKVDDKEETNNDGTKIEDATIIGDQNCFKTPALPCNNFVCPRSQQALAKKYPEIVIDEFSLLLFHSMDDFLLLKKHEDCLKQMEEDKKRKRRYEEAVCAGKIKKMGRKRKAENDLKREKKDNSEQRQLARFERKERRKREKEENRQRKNNKLIISTPTPTNENLPNNLNNLSSISTNVASTLTPFANNNNICCMEDDNDEEENNGVNKTVFV